MRQWYKRQLGFFLSAVLLYALTVPGAFAEANKPYVDDIKANKAALQALQNKNKKLEEAYSASQKALRSHDLSLAKLRRELQDLEHKMAANKEELAATQSQLEQTLEQISNEQQAMRQQLRIAYQQGRPHPLQLILSQQQPGTWEQIAAYHQAFMETRNKRFLALSALEEEKKAQEAQLLSLSQALKAQTQEASNKTAHIEKLRDQQQQTAKRIDAEKGQNASQIKKLTSERESLESLLSLWQSRQVYSQPFSKRKGKLDWPVAGTIVSGSKKLTKAHQKGIFIAAKPGTEVKAVHGGQVIFADWLRGFGMMCIIDHGDGFLTLYGHNESLSLSPGDQVQTGQRIGVVGNSGGMSQSGLYFELRSNGKANDAQQWLAKK